MIRAMLIAIVLSVSAHTKAQVQSPVPEVDMSIAKKASSAYPAKDVTFPNGVRGIPGVVYWVQEGYRELTLDLYLPPSSVERPAAGFPFVVWIHGGGWRSGNANRKVPFVDFPGVLASLSARGYVVASIEYRLSSEAKFPAQAQDTKAAIRWLRVNASKYGIDPARAVTWGGSAGGHLAALAAVSGDAAELQPVPYPQSFLADPNPDGILSANVSDRVQGAVVWFGVFNFATFADQAREAKFQDAHDNPDSVQWRLLGHNGKELDPRKVAAASPISYVDRNTPPMLLIHGTEDQIVPFHQSLEMAEKLKSAGVKHELIVMPGQGHVFINGTPEEARDANLKALEATFRFIDETIGSASNTNQ